MDLTTNEGVVAYLATSPWPCTRVEKLSGGTANFTWRAHLVEPLNGARTVVVKHARDYAAFSRAFSLSSERQHYEAEALRYVRDTLGDEAVTVPDVLLEDEDHRVLVMSDCGLYAVDLKTAVLAGRVTVPAALSIGKMLGRFLARLHALGKAEEVLERFAGNTDALRLSTWATYGRLEDTLTGERIQPPVSLSETQLGTLREVVARRSREMAHAPETLTMCDFWPGNILLSFSGEDSNLDVSAISVVDWEFAKPGLPGLDIGQLCGELYCLERMSGSPEAATALRLAFQRAYSQSTKTDVALARVAATHAGVHLSVWTPGNWAKYARCREVVGEGVDMTLAAFEGSEDWLRTSIMSELLPQALTEDGGS